MSTPTPEQVVRGHQAAVAAVRARVLSFARIAWAAQGSYRDADVDRLVSLIVPRVLAGQVQVAQLTAVYIATLTGTAAAVVDRAVVLNGRGVEPSEVYRRPAVEVYTALAGGKSFADAVKAGGLRLLSLIGTDMQMASVRQARESMGAARVVGFRRVLTGRENCALCTLAATQRYHRESLMPIHPGCDCTVAAVTNPASFDQDAELEQAHEAIGDRFGQARVDRGGRDPLDYRKAILVREHGEIGPVLTLKEHQFTGPSDL